jgi:hypothetical protein
MRHRFPMIVAALALLLCTAAAFAQAPTAPPKPGPEVKKMAAMIGTWTTTYDMKPMPGMSPGGKGTSTSTCVWTAGGFGVSCTEKLDMGAMGKTTGVSLMFYDAEAKNYVHSEVDSAGETFVSHGTVNGDTWVFETDSPMMGKPMHSRFTITYTSKDSSEMKFELGPDANSMKVGMDGKQKRVMSATPAPKPTTNK